MNLLKRVLTLGVMLMLLSLGTYFGTSFVFNTNSVMAFSGGSIYFEKEYIPIENAVLSADTNVLTPGGVATLSVNLFPSYAASTASEPAYEIIGGRNLAVINDNLLTAGELPGVVTVIARVDNVQTDAITITIEKEPEVFIPVESVEINSTVTNIYEGASIDLESVFSSTVEPFNATNQFITYELAAESRAYANLVGSKITVNDNLPAGNLSISVRGHSGGIVSSPVEISLYVPAKQITFTADNMSPMATMNGGDTVRLTSNVEGISTLSTPSITVLSGAKFIQGGAVINNEFKVKPNRGSTYGSNRLIKLRAEQDGITKELTLDVYIPVEEFTITPTESFDRGEEIFFNTAFNPYANDMRWDGYCSLSGAELDVTGKVVKVPQTTPAGTKVTVTYWSLDRLGKVFTADFYVAELDTHTEESFVKASAMNTTAFTLNYENDSAGTEIKKEYKQLWVGRSAEVEIRYNGLPISLYGITDSQYAVRIVSGSATATVNKVAGGKFKINVRSYASGKNKTFSYQVTIQDGTAEPYTLPIQTLSIFRPMSGTLGLESTTLTNQTETLKTSTVGKTWDANATPGTTGILFEIGDRNGVTLDGVTGQVTVTNTYIASWDNTIGFVCTQLYNGNPVEYNSGNYMSPVPIWMRYVQESQTSKLAYVLFRSEYDDDLFVAARAGGASESAKPVDLDFNSLIKLGYTTMTFDIGIRMAEQNDGYQHVYLETGNGYDLYANDSIEHTPGKADSEFKWHYFSKIVDISTFLDNSGESRSIWLSYFCHGAGQDDWWVSASFVAITIS